MRESRKKRRDGIMYHVGRPGEDHYTNRCITAWGVDGHNSHTNICSAGRGPATPSGPAGDRPSPDHANARVILLISSHLETGHYFNPHAQRIIEGKDEDGAKIITFDPRLSNTASKSDVWLPTWPGSETAVLLAIANHLIQTGRTYDRDFVRRWVNWEEFLARGDTTPRTCPAARRIEGEPSRTSTTAASSALRGVHLRARRAGGQVPVERVREAAAARRLRRQRLATPTRLALASIGNLGGWQVARCLFFLNVLTGSVGTKGGTSGLNSWNKFVPKPFKQPPAFTPWNELHLPTSGRSPSTR